MSVFICYRRDDAEREARALYTTLAEETDESNLFLDHDAIGVGENWRARIDETLKKVRAVLVVIGPAWFEHLERRLKDGTTDTVRAEIAASLAQLNVQGIPITVKGARLPSGSSLPSDISALTDRNAIEVRGSAWRDDTNRLIKTLRREGALPISRRMWRLRGAAVIGVVAIVGTIAAMLTRVPTIPTSMSPRYAKQLVETGGLHFKELRVQRGQFQGNIVETAARGIPVAVGQRPAPGQVRLRGQTVEVDFILREAYRLVCKGGGQLSLVSDDETLGFEKHPGSWSLDMKPGSCAWVTGPLHPNQQPVLKPLGFKNQLSDLFQNAPGGILAFCAYSEYDHPSSGLSERLALVNYTQFLTPDDNGKLNPTTAGYVCDDRF